MEKNEAGGKGQGAQSRFYDFKKCGQQGISKVTFEQTPEGYMGVSLVDIWGKNILEACRNSREASMAGAKGVMRGAADRKPERLKGGQMA